MKVSEFIREYQTIVGAAIAFIGVSWTLYWNARAGRKLERFKIEQQKTALLAALRAELAIIQAELARQWAHFISLNGDLPENWTYGDHKGIAHPQLSVAVYDKNMDKIGLLGVGQYAGRLCRDVGGSASKPKDYCRP